MKTLKRLLYKIPGFEKLDRFTDTRAGENTVWALCLFAVLLIIIYQALPTR